MKKHSQSKKQFNLTQHACMKIMLSCLIGTAFNSAYALPAGEVVKSGDASFVRDGQTLNINQTSQQVVVNWQSFGIAANEAVNLYQPNQGSALFRVVGANPSQIFGSLTATGSLFLINPNGILFTPGAQVDVGSLVASTLQMSDKDYLAKKYKFNGDSTAPVINKGAIRTEDGGYIVLLGNTVENSGSLVANQGSVVLASAQSALLDFYGDGLVQVKLDGDALNAVVNNTGNITADGGAVQLATNARTAAINVSGVVQANSLVERNGVIRLEGGANSTVLVSGKLEASGKTANAKGGYVAVTGERVGLLDGATVDVSGNTGGGTALVGGDYQGKNTNIQNADRTYVASGASIVADALDSGDGGKVVVWANDITRYYGNISAKGGANAGDGGFVEVSGKNYLDFNGLVNTSASYGAAGRLLLDPTNITISTGVNSIESSGATIFQETTSTATSILNTTTLQNALALNNVEVTTASPAAGVGTITVSNAVSWASGNSLTLTANSTIAINAAITTGTAASALILNATGNVTQSGAGIIGGAGGLTKNGAGTATLSLANTYTGATNINAGTLALNATGTIANSSGVANAGNFSIAAAKTIDSMTGTGTTALGANILTIGDASNTSSTYSGVASGTGGITKAGTGMLTLSGANTYTGATTINAGTLKYGANNAISTGAVTVNGGTLDVGTFTDTVGAVTLTSGSITGTTGVLTGTSYAMQSGTVSAILGGAGALTKTTAGTVTLSGANTYTGATTINAGTLQLAGGAAIADTSAVTLANVAGAVLDLNGTNETIGSLAGGGATGGIVTLGAGTLTTGVNNNATTYTGVMSGTGGLTKVGTGVMTLGGVNTYTGATAISAGTLALNAVGTIAASSGVANAGTFSIAAAKTIDSMTGAGATTLGANILIIGDASNTSSTYAGVATGTGGITKAGTGILTLSGNNTYTGLTTIAAGTLAEGTNNALASGAVTVSGGIFDIGTFTDTVGVVTLASGNINGTTGVLTGTSYTMQSGTVTAVLGGAGALTKTTAGTVTLSGANTYVGATAVNAGVLIAANSAALGTTASGTTVASGATLALQGGIAIGAEALSINGIGVASSGALNNISGNNSYGGTITLAGNSEVQSDAGELTLGAANAFTGTTRTLTVDGSGNTAINGTITTTTGTLTKNGTGTLTVSGVNTYTGLTTINTGTLKSAANNTISTGAVTVNNGGTYDLNGFSDTIGALAVNSGITGGTVTTGAGTLTLGGNVTSTGGASNASISGNFSMGAATRTFTTTNAADGLIVSAVVSGATGLTKAGNGTLTLSGANTYTGATTVSAGTLTAANATALGTVATGTTVANGATLNVNNVNLAAEAITINGNGVGAAGALTGTGTAVLAGNVTTASNSAIGTTSMASVLTLNGVVTAPNNLGIVGAGDVTASNAANNFSTVNINGAKNVNLRDTNAIVLGNGASNLTGDLIVRAGGNVTLANTVTTTGGDLTLAGTNFINNAGSSALAASGRWLVYSTAPASDTFGGLLSGNQAIWNTIYPVAVSQTGNRYVFTNTPNLTVTSTNQTKTYGQDGAPIVANAYTVTGFINAATFGNVFTQDTAVNTVTGSAISTGSSVTANVSGYSIDVTPITATTGYTLTKNATGVLTVNPATLTVTANDQTKTYGQTFNFVGTEFTSAGLQNGETIGSASFTSAGATNTANVVGSPYVITANTATGGTFNASNYVISYVDGAMTVTPATINLNGTRTYNGTTAFNASDFSAVNGVLGQTLNLSGAGSVASANAGAAQSVSLDSLALLDGTGVASNYTLSGGTYTGTISQASITVSTTDVTKTYDGNTTAAGTAILTGGTLFNNASNGGTLDSLSGGTFAYTDKNAGINNKTVITSAVAINDGNSGGNYQITYVDNTTSTINKANITAVTGITAADKTYDGNTSATLNTASAGFTGIVAGESLNVGTATGAFNSKNVISANTVNISGITLADGADLASNYNLTNDTASTAANITTKTITAVTGITAADKTYDGNTSATLSTASAGFTGIVTGENLSVGAATGTFNSKNVISANTVNISGITLADKGADLASNYNLANDTASAAANITTKTITAVTGITAADKTYDGNTSTTLNTASAGFTGIVAGESLNVGSATGAFNSKNVISANTVNISGITLADNGADLASNYNLTNTNASTTTVINVKDITAVTGITAADKIYDGNTSATLNAASAGFTGIVAGESLNVGTATGTFNSKNVVTANTVNISDITLADNGADLASNYNLTNTNASAAAVITPKALTVTADSGQIKVLGSADPASFTYVSGGLVFGDAFTGALIRNSGEATGNYAINQGTLSAGSNYALTYIGNNFTIVAPVTSPRNDAGLVDLNPMLSNYTNQQLFVLNVGATAAGNNTDGSGADASNCEQQPEPLAKDKDFILMLNFGLKLPKGMSTTCI